MSNNTKNLKKRIKAPRELVSAVKKGELVTLVRKSDTHATHIRRFSKAFAAYACAALVLICGSLALPWLLKEPTAPLSQPSGSEGTSTETDRTVLPANYIRSDLIWANELNPELKDTVIWSAEFIDGAPSVIQALTLPTVGGEDAEYAVEFRIQFRDMTTDENATLSFLATRMAMIDVDLRNIGFEEIHLDFAEDGTPGASYFYAASREELSALDTDELWTLLNKADGNIQFILRMAWQSLDGSQIPDDELYLTYYHDAPKLDLSDLALKQYVFTDTEGYIRPDLVWANELNPACRETLFYAEHIKGDTRAYPLSNKENLTGYTLAVDLSLQIIPKGLEKNQGLEQVPPNVLIKGEYLDRMVERALGWEPIEYDDCYSGGVYAVTCEQLMALDADVLTAFAEAYEAFYGVDADSISAMTVSAIMAWQWVDELNYNGMTVD